MTKRYLPKHLTPETMRAWKEAVDLTYEQLGVLSPYHPRTWQKWIGGERRPRPVVRIVMADIEATLGLH